MLMYKSSEMDTIKLELTVKELENMINSLNVASVVTKSEDIKKAINELMRLYNNLGKSEEPTPKVKSPTQLPENTGDISNSAILTVSDALGIEYGDSYFILSNFIKYFKDAPFFHTLYLGDDISFVKKLRKFGVADAFNVMISCNIRQENEDWFKGKTYEELKEIYNEQNNNTK